MTSFLFRNWCEETELCSFDVSSSIPFNQLSFNPMNWRQLSGSSDTAFSIWNIEQVNEGNHLVEKYVVVVVVVVVVVIVITIVDTFTIVAVEVYCNKCFC